jgi:hypothetical protein
VSSLSALIFWHLSDIWETNNHIGAEAPNANDPAPDPALDATTIAAVTRSPRASVLEANLSSIASGQSLEAPMTVTRETIGMIAVRITDMAAIAVVIAAATGEASMSISAMSLRAMAVLCMRGGDGVGGRLQM